MDKVYQYPHELYDEVSNISNKYGMTIEDVISVFLARVKQEQSLDFLLNTRGNKMGNIRVGVSNEMTKTRAMNLFILKGFEFSEYTVFASKNRTAYNYWANVDIHYLNHDWFFILNNWEEKELYLFKIPANSLTKYDIVTRNDKPNTIDLQIIFEDPLFTDSRSGVSFKKYLIEKVNY